MDIEVTTAPTDTATSVVSLAEVKDRLKIVTTRRDADLTRNIEEAFDQFARPANNLLNRTILQTGFRLFLPRFPLDRSVLRLPFPPLRSVEAISYRNSDGAQTAYAASNYVVRTGDAQLVGEVESVSGTWPSTQEHPRAVWINFTAGYVTVPQEFKTLIKLMVGHYDSNTEATINEPRQMAVNRKVEFGVDHLIRRLRVDASMTDNEFLT